jgi:hypothetical protein
MTTLCVWCCASHSTPLQLCPACEARAAALKLADVKARGIPVAGNGEEPDD